MSIGTKYKLEPGQKNVKVLRKNSKAELGCLNQQQKRVEEEEVKQNLILSSYNVNASSYDNVINAANTAAPIQNNNNNDDMMMLQIKNYQQSEYFGQKQQSGKIGGVQQQQLLQVEDRLAQGTGIFENLGGAQQQLNEEDFGNFLSLDNNNVFGYSQNQRKQQQQDEEELSCIQFESNFNYYDEFNSSDTSNQIFSHDQNKNNQNNNVSSFQGQEYLLDGDKDLAKIDEMYEFNREQDYDSSQVIGQNSSTNYVVQQQNQNQKQQLGQEEIEEEEEGPEICFEQPDFSQIGQKKQSLKCGNNKDNNNDSTVPLWKVSQQIQKRRKQNDYDKNICRYIARCIVRCFTNYSYKEQVHRIIQSVLECVEQKHIDNLKKKQQELIEISDSYINNQQQQFSLENSQQEDESQEQDIQEVLYRSGREYMLKQLESLTGHRALQDILTYNDENKQLEKMVFRQFSHWFLKERAVRYIMSGNMRDKQSYLRYKNKVMLKFIDRPENWTCNYVRVRKK